MKQTACLCLVLIIFSSCAPKGEVPERAMEDGVEVVLNRHEPYSINVTPTTFTHQM